MYVWWSYLYSYSRGGLPQSELPAWLWVAAFVLSAASGVFAVFLFLDRTQRRKTMVLVAYGISIVVLNLILHGVAACSMGDCI